ncbi:MAG: RNA methyltransferase [Planctomycetia bacterium]|nr:RNA methyltransferase [Planctomycetia bacterium]
MNDFESITSPANPRVRQAAGLRDADARRTSGLTLVDGRRELARAAAAGVPVVEVFLDASRPVAAVTTAEDAAFAAWLRDAAAGGTRIVELSSRAFERVAFGGRNEGVVGVVRFAPRTLPQVAFATGRPLLVVEGVEKPGNLGAVLRTADAAGLAGVIVCDGRTDAANPAAIRASLGTVFTVPLAAATARDTIDWCRADGRLVFAAMPGGGREWHEAALAGHTAIVLGSEAWGISPAWGEAGDAGVLRLETIRLPMHGSADSLNLSVTAAVLAYEALRQERIRS